MLTITTINVLAVLLFSFIAGFGWALGGQVCAWVFQRGRP